MLSEALTSPPRPPFFTRQTLLHSLPLTAICLLPVLLYFPFLATPFERDEGVYATVAKGLMEGQVPYRDLFDNKPPLVYGWYALSFTLFGEHVVAPRLLAAVLLSLTTLSVFGQARMVFSRPVAYLAAGLFGLSTGLPWVALHANTEAYMLLPLVTSLVAFTIGMRRQSLRWLLVSGLLCGAAMMTKQVALWNLMALAAVATVWAWKVQGLQWRAATPAGALVSGAALAVALISVPFIVTGSLSDLYYANISYNWLYVGVLSYSERLFFFLIGITLFAAVAAPFVAGALWGVLTLLRGRPQPVHYLIVAWALASAAGVATGGRFFPHYFLHLMPALAVLSAVGVYELAPRILPRRPARGAGNLTSEHQRPLRPVWRPVLIIAPGLLIVSLMTNGVLYLAPRQAERQVSEVVYTQKQWESASMAIGQYIKERTEPGDKIFNFGREAQIYFYADRQPAVRYFADWPFWWDEDTLYQTIKALRATRPVYIIDSAQPPLFDYEKLHPPVLMNLLNENYDYAGRVHFADIYKLKEDRP